MSGTALPVTIAAGPDSAGRAQAGALSAADLAELLTAFNDVTRKLESTHDQLRAEVVRLNQELAAANEAVERSRRLAALGEMAAGIAHEIRNPLGSIRLYARMLEEDLAGQPGPLRVAGRIGEAARGMDAIVRDVLAFARAQELRREAIEGEAVLSAALEAVLEDPALSGLEAVVVRADAQRPEDQRPVLDADPLLLRQAAANVIRNGLQAMSERPGPARMVLDALVSEAGGRRWGVLRVSDSGPGVPGEVMKRMFNPFFTTRAAGTGLGLAIVHRIVDGHGGRVQVRNNEDGPGATVELVLPLAGAGAASGVPARTGSVISRGGAA